MESRNLVFSEGTSNKFWNITLNGTEHTVQFGKVGTAGQSQTKTFATEAEAKSAYTKLVAEKVKKGYTDADKTGQPATPSPAPVAKVQAVTRAETALPTDSIEANEANEAIKPTEPTEPIITEIEATSVADSSALSREDANPATPSATVPVIPRDLPLAAPPPPRYNLGAGALSWIRGGNVVVKTRPEPLPFDFAACMARLQSIKERGYYDWGWSVARIQLAMSREEAEFWLATMVPTLKVEDKHKAKSMRYQNPQEMALFLANATFSGEVPVMETIDAIKSYTYTYTLPPDVVLPLYVLYGWEDMLHIVVTTMNKHYVVDRIVDGVRTKLLPSLTAQDIELGRTALRAHLISITKTTPISLLQIAARIGGMEEEIRVYLKNIPDNDGYGGDYGSENLLLQVVLGLSDPDEVEKEIRRIDLFPKCSAEVEGLLAATQSRCLDLALRAILKQTEKGGAESMAKALARAETPENAPCMLDVLLESKAPRVGREWFDAHPDHAIIGLVPLVKGDRTKRTEVALDLLRTYRQRGHFARITEQIERLDDTTAGYLRQQVLEYEVVDYPTLPDAGIPAWLQTALEASKATPTNVDSVRGGELPPVPIVLPTGTVRLSAKHAGKLLAALRKSTWEEVDPLVIAVREHIDRPALNAFVWKLFEGWLKDGAPSKARWEMMALGFLGNDASVLKLAPMIRVWPGEAQHARAVVGLECLRAIGSDTALMQINGIAQKVAFKGLKERAGQCMEDIARTRGMSREELEDRIVPDCGLDARGTRIFDFGPRQFTFVLGQDMKPMIRDAERNRRSDLPKPNSKDDAEKATTAVEEWKLLKKQISEVTKIQLVRLEQAMVTGRRWKPEDFDLLLVRQPLMINLVRLLIWGAYDAEGKLLTTFRVTEDQTLADQNDDFLELPASATNVGLVHTLHLSEEVRNAWGQILSDYEILAPFPQIGRPIYGLEGDEAKDSKITRFDKIDIPAQTLVFTLDKLEWARGAAMDAGIFSEHVKSFHASDITAVVTYQNGVPVGYMDGWDDQQIDTIFFLRGTNPSTGWMSWQHEKAIPLAEVDPVVLSEVLKDVISIVSRVGAA